MKIRIVSDLHLEVNYSVFYPMHLPELPDDKDTILILAGDICRMDKLEVAALFFGDVCRRFKHVLYVFGNHEFYKTRLDDAYLIFFDVIGKHYSNLTFTTDGAVYKDSDCKFILATLWTAWDHPQTVLHTSNEYSMRYCQREMGDFFLIKDEEDELFTPEKSKEIHGKHIEFIRKELEMNDYDKSVVIVHHAPSLKSIHSRYFKHPLNPAFSSNLSEFWNKYKPDLIVHGHCHNTFHYMENEKTRVICNPRGYGGETPNFYPELEVEL